MEKNVVGQSEQLQQKMDMLDRDASGIDAKLQKAQNDMDAKMKKAQDDLVVRMNAELPRIMDNYIRTRAPQIERQAMKQVPH